jgi:hypothetical protein
MLFLMLLQDNRNMNKNRKATITKETTKKPKKVGKE